jgi:hypothetical protein
MISFSELDGSMALAHAPIASSARSYHWHHRRMGSARNQAAAFRLVSEGNSPGFPK